MPEVGSARRTELADLSGGGFFMRRISSPGAVVAKGAVKPLARRVLTPSSNKENVPPAWAVRSVPKWRSPLPEWYPRTPLRDITSVVKAVERKNGLRGAAARQQIQWNEDSPQSVDLTTPVQPEQGVPQRPPAQETLRVVASGTSTCLDKGKLVASDCLQTPAKPNDPALADLMEKELSISIEQIEKIVCRNLRRAPKAAQPSKTAVQRRTLMSMR